MSSHSQFRALICVIACTLLRFGGHALADERSADILGLTTHAEKVGTGFAWTTPAPVWLNEGNVLGWKEQSYLHYSPFLLNTKTGKRTSPAGLHQALKKRSNRWEGWMRASPDGKWLLWPFGGRTPLSGWFACSVDGSVTTTVQREEYPAPHLLWSRDSSTWMAIAGDRTASGWAAWHYSPQTGKEIRKVPLPDISGAFKSAGSTLYGYNGIYPIGTDSRGRGLFIPYGLKDEATVPIYASDVLAGKGPIEKHVVRVPGSVRFLEVSSNPAKDLLAWLFYRDRPPHGHRARVEVWLSRCDGAGIRLIATGAVTRLHRGHVLEDDFPQHLQWLPGGSQLSFTRNGSLYTLPVH